MQHFRPPGGGQQTRACRDLDRRRREKSHKGVERRRPLDKAARGRILRFLNIHTRWTPGGRAVTHLHVRIIRIALFDFLNGQNGRCDPSQAKIAELAGCDEDTVRKALQRAEKLGVVTWCHRWFRGIVDGARRVQRTTNGYLFTVPDAMPGPLPARSDRLVQPGKTHKPTNSGGTLKKEYISLLSATPVPPPAPTTPWIGGPISAELLATIPDRIKSAYSALSDTSEGETYDNR